MPFFEYPAPFDEEINSLGIYHPYRRNGERNPEFDDWSGKILDLKQSNPDAVTYFAKYIAKNLDNIDVVCTVPSHDPMSPNNPLDLICSKIVSPTTIDGSGVLKRHKKIEKLATGGDRSQSVHTNSICVARGDIVNGKKILLIDDVTTTGNSLLACKNLLLKAGASSVKCLAIGRTV